MTMTLSSIVIEVIRTVFIYLFFYQRYFKCKKHKQKHLSSIQTDISRAKVTCYILYQLSLCIFFKCSICK